MSKESYALSTVPPESTVPSASAVPSAAPTQADYDAIRTAIMDSARGRWFLDEFSRRNRNADTRLVLDAIARVEAVIRGDGSREACQNGRINVLEMARAIAETRAEVGGIAPEIAPPSKLAQVASSASHELSQPASDAPTSHAALSLAPTPAPTPTPLLATNDPLAALKALSDEERIALFT